MAIKGKTAKKGSKAMRDLKPRKAAAKRIGGGDARSTPPIMGRVRRIVKPGTDPSIYPPVS